MISMLLAYALLLAVDRYGYYVRRRDMAGFWTRRFLYLLPLWVPLFLADGWPRWHFHGAALLLALATALVTMALNVSAIRRLFDPALAGLLGPPGARSLAADTLTQVAGGVSEEFFFRWYVVGILYGCIGWWAVPASAAMFVAHHAVHPRASHLYSALDHLAQLITGLGFAGATLVGGSLLAPVVGHLAYNLVILAGQYYRLPRVLRRFTGPGSECGNPRCDRLRRHLEGRCG